MSGAAVEAVERALERLGDDPWRAFLHVEGDAARERARRAPEGPLHGLVASVKDNLAWAGRPMTCGSRHLERYVAPYTATVIERLEAAGAVVLGKTNMDEFAAGSSGENSAFGPTLNPRDASRVPGGSSSGAGASVAAGVADLALGSDTGGSARCPGAFCGVAAFKPSHGLVSRHGLADLAMSLESPAPLAKDVATLERVMRAIAGPDARDAATGLTLAAPEPLAPDSLRVGVPREYFEGIDADVERPVRDALRRLEAKGATLVEVSLPSLRHALAAYYVTNYAEFASAMARLDGFRYGTPGEGATAPEMQAAARASFGAEVKRRILLGTFVTSRDERGAWYEAAVKARAQVAREYADALARCDVLMGPTMPMRAFRLGERVADPRAMYAADVLTVSANLARVPAGSVPLKVDGLPVGLQVVGRHGDDARVLDAMKVVESL
ncbi:MAG TPA: amidase family protein [Candidatus Thermoplasmatota archaeon]|nr:amidase family protein [Candidatus Thermoplasmatota archaeon]